MFVNRFCIAHFGNRPHSYEGWILTTLALSIPKSIGLWFPCTTTLAPCNILPSACLPMHYKFITPPLHELWTHHIILHGTSWTSLFHTQHKTLVSILNCDTNLVALQNKQLNSTCLLGQKIGNDLPNMYQE
jgi:hypothetical protein